MPRKLKQVFLAVSKSLGLFHLAGLATRRGLRILCYHGFSTGDESAFRPRLFISRETFQRRMAFLADERFPVLGLSAALAAMDEGRLPPRATVITIDDGFHSVHKTARDVLARHRFPATVYVTSYYARKETPVFRLVVQYQFWRTRRDSIDLGRLGDGLAGVFSLRDPLQKDAAAWAVIRHGEERRGERQRIELAHCLGEMLDVKYESVRASRALSLMNGEELRELAAAGLDIQLHTHRHTFPDEERSAAREIDENRAYLEPFAATRLVHFCYPSGIWSERQWPVLAERQIASATTCVPGLNYGDTPRLGLMRFLDSEEISQIEFEAEMWGYLELLRRLRSGMTSLTSGPPRSPRTVKMPY